MLCSNNEKQQQGSTSDQQPTSQSPQDKHDKHNIHHPSNSTSA
jgi:hypothetical protein